MVDLARVLREIRKALVPVHRRTRLMIARAVLNLVADDSESMQRVQVDVYEGQTADEVENFQPLGLTSVPSKDAEGIAVSIGGNQDHTVMLGVNDPSIRPTGLSEGETQLYDKTGSKVYLLANGNILIDSSGSYVDVAGSDSAIARADYVDNRFDIIEAWVTAIVTVYNVHKHDYTDGTTQVAKTSGNTSSDPMGPIPPLLTVAATKGRVS